MEKVQKICVAAFLHHQGRVLILRRSMKETFLPGHWDIPGGKLKFGEMPDEALRREAMEEIGLEIEVGRPYNLFSYVSKKGQWHCVDIQFLAEVKGDASRIKLSKDHDEYRWIAKDELCQYFDISNQMKNALQGGFEEIERCNS